MKQDRIKERLLKMYRLATDGVDGEKERKENAELRMEVKGYIANLNKTAEAASYFNERYEAAKRQLDESNKQIEIYAKKVRNLEADLEEGGLDNLVNEFK